jgi:hypothetical protein
MSVTVGPGGTGSGLEIPPVLDGGGSRSVWLRRRGGWAWLVLGLGILAGLWMLHLQAPGVEGWYPRCGLFMRTGLHCPGCGSLRAMHHLTHGRWAEALGSNALLVVGLPVLGGWMAWRACRRGRPGQARYVVGPRMVLWAGGILLLFGVLRNLPWFPFHLLAP